MPSNISKILVKCWEREGQGKQCELLAAHQAFRDQRVTDPENWHWWSDFSSVLKKMILEHSGATAESPHLPFACLFTCHTQRCLHLCSPFQILHKGFLWAALLARGAGGCSFQASQLPDARRLRRGRAGFCGQNIGSPARLSRRAPVLLVR